MPKKTRKPRGFAKEVTEYINNRYKDLTADRAMCIDELNETINNNDLNTEAFEDLKEIRHRMRELDYLERTLGLK